jgi:hypothetical protein
MIPAGTERIRRRPFYQGVFGLAGIYNMVWGLYAVVDPQWLFQFAGMPLALYPELFACLGVVIGLYGVLYLYVACFPERGWLIAAVGMAGKILGPIGAVFLIWQGKWTAKAFLLCIPNDLIWWIPFGLYLFDAWKSFFKDFVSVN